MFIRVRKRQLKDGRLSTHYQLVQSVREGDRVKSKVIASLGYSPTINQAITKYQTKIIFYQKILTREEQKPRYKVRSFRAQQTKLTRYQKMIDYYTDAINKLSLYL